MTTTTNSARQLATAALIAFAILMIARIAPEVAHLVAEIETEHLLHAGEFVAELVDYFDLPVFAHEAHDVWMFVNVTAQLLARI